MRVVFVIVSLVFAASLASGEVVRYRDRAGRMHYVNDPARVPEEYKDQIDSKPLPPINYREQPAVREPSGLKSTPVAKRSVEVYVTSWCPACKQLEAYLKQKEIPFKRYDVEKNSAAAQTHRRLGGAAVPLIKIGSATMTGFSPEWISQQLAK